MKYLQKITGILHYIRYGERLRPARDWYILVAFALAILVASFFWNTWLFTNTLEGGGTGVATSTPTFTPASIDAVAQLFSKRADQTALYQSGYHFVDPSVPGS